MNKECPICGIITSPDNFYNHHNSSGLQILCKKCHQAKYISKEILAYNKWNENKEKNINYKDFWNEKYKKWEKAKFPKHKLKKCKPKKEENIEDIKNNYTFPIKKDIIKTTEERRIKEQDAKRIDDIASIRPTGEKLQELKNELIDEE